MGRISTAVFLSYALTSIITWRLAGAICEDIPDNQLVCTENCQTVTICISNRPIEIEDCFVETLNCYQTNATAFCTRISQCGGPIVCTDVGEFPDPDYCTLYHTCDAPITPLTLSTVQTCPTNTGWDISINACVLPLNASVCSGDGPVPECKNLNQRGALPKNPQYYYKCVMEDGAIYPQMRVCEDDFVYYESEDACVYGNMTTLPTEGTTTTASTLPTEATTTVSSTLPTEPTTWVGEMFKKLLDGFVR